MRTTFLALGLSLISLSCTTDAPTAVQSPPVTHLTPSASAPSLSASAGNSGCYTVAGTISETGVFPTFTGTIAGDLVGTSSTTLSFDTRFTGAVVHGPGERALTITGGNIPELIGVTIHEVFDGLTISEAPPLARINERTRIVSGAERGNLTTHGTIDFATFPWEVELEYRGVICP
jgi:hypothetical protein